MEGLVEGGERGEWRVRGVSSAQPANSPHDNVPRAARGPTRGDRLGGYRGEGASTEASHHRRPCHAPCLLLTRSPPRPPPHPHHRQPHRNVRGRRCRRRAWEADGQEPHLAPGEGVYCMYTAQAQRLAPLGLHTHPLLAAQLFFS